MNEDIADFLERAADGRPSMEEEEEGRENQERNRQAVLDSDIPDEDKEFALLMLEGDNRDRVSEILEYIMTLDDEEDLEEMV